MTTPNDPPAPLRPVAGEAEVEAMLDRWAAGQITAPEVKAWVDRVAGADPIVRELLAELDLLEVYLLTPEDVPALLAFLGSADVTAGLDEWTRYRDAIDLDERSRRLKRDKFYKPFCR